jgi:trehalose-6-phosphatase
MGTAIIAIGDDRTDEQLFSALPPDAMTIYVGEGPSRARLRLSSVAEVRLLLSDLARTAPGRASDESAAAATDPAPAAPNQMLVDA